MKKVKTTPTLKDLETPAQRSSSTFVRDIYPLCVKNLPKSIPRGPFENGLGDQKEEEKKKVEEGLHGSVLLL
jgi:hypothetical protein